MIQFNITSELKKLERDIGAIDKRVLPKARAQAINKTGPSVETAIIKKVSQDTKIKQKDIRSAVKPRRFRASIQRPYFIINFEDAKAGNLINFVPPSKRNHQFFRKRTKKGFKYKGVSANAWGNRKTYRGTFIGRGRGSGKLLVFKREGRGLDVVWGPSPKQTFNKPENILLMKTKTAERFPFEMSRAIAFQLRKQIK